MKILLKLLPLLFLYIIIVLYFSKPELEHDEGRYFRYAQHITEGYLTDSENPYLANGPGYPLYLSIFVGLDLPLIVPKLFNALLIIIGLYFFYKLIQNFVAKRTAIILTYILGLYFPMFSWITMNITEPLTFVLTCSFIYFTYNLVSAEKWKFNLFITPSLALAGLILTKIIFSYVAIVGTIIFFIYFLISQNNNGLKFTAILCCGFILSTPYFFYTYTLTGKLFYTSTASGLGLYWMSSKYQNEYGSCLSSTYHTLYKNAEINEAHKKLFDSLEPYSYIERNEILLSKAKENIKDNPVNYIVNITNNISRILFNFPFSYRNQSLKTHWYLIYNFILILGFLISLYPAWINRKSISSEIVMLGIFFLIYFAGSSLVIALSRMFFPIIPFLLLWNTYIFSKYLRVAVINK